MCRYGTVCTGVLSHVAHIDTVSGGLKSREKDKTRGGGGHAAVSDCFVGTNSVAQLSARADGFNYFRLKLNRARRV